MIKNLPATQETQVRSLRQEDPLEKEMTAHSSVLAWDIPWIEEPGGLQFLELGCKESEDRAAEQQPESKGEDRVLGVGMSHRDQQHCPLQSHSLQ